MALPSREPTHPSYFGTPKETPNGLQVDLISSCNKRTSHVLCLQVLLTVQEGRVTINTLPNDVLVLIFYLDRMIHLDQHHPEDRIHWPWRWDRLVHVCQQWRSVVFASPSFSRPGACLLSLHTDRAHWYLATLTNHNNGRLPLEHGQKL